MLKIIFTIIATIALVITAILLLIRSNERKIQDKYGNHFQEKRYLENIGKFCLVTNEEKEEYNLPDCIRFKGKDIISNEIIYTEGTRTCDQVVKVTDKGNEFSQVISERKLSHTEHRNINDEGFSNLLNSLINFKENFVDCESIIEISTEKEIYYLYCKKFKKQEGDKDVQNE